jgi:hypothetical protein
MDTEPTLEARWAESPVLLGIQRILHRASEALTRPFEHWALATSPMIRVLRLDGIQHRALFVGDLP